jgi:prolyl-tRNA editing enzyme YbaK/EbsC (Cys-tRNA(Pro) deacylase)
MPIETARAFLRTHGLEHRVREFDVSSATVDLAAAALGVEGARICKSLSFKTAAGAILILAAGDARVDNRKFKEQFGEKAKMLSPDECLELIGHGVGGVCPFGINPGVVVYADESINRFTTVFPAVGSANSAIELSPDELYGLSGASMWVDVCKLPGDI